MVTWASDDGFYTKDSLKLCIKMHDEQNLGFKDIVIARHVEGRNHGGKQEPNEFWNAWHHPTLRLGGIPEDYYIILNGMMKLDYLRELGGIDCIYENYNMNLHDLAFRTQRAGSKLYFSPTTVLNCDWNPNQGDHKPVATAHADHDMPLFNKLMANPQPDRIKIDLFNWTKSDKVWKRRFGDMK